MNNRQFNALAGFVISIFYFACEMVWLLIKWIASYLSRPKSANSYHNKIDSSDCHEDKSKQCGQALAAAVNLHIAELSIKEQQSVISGDYGLKDTRKWDAEKKRFYYQVLKPIADKIEPLDKSDEERLLGLIDLIIMKYRAENPIQAAKEYTDSFDPIEYEIYCARQLEKNGWHVRTTASTGDQGGDIIASKEKLIVVIQCKKYSSPVGNKAVQEVFAAQSFYNAKRAVVVSNANYTISAKQLAGKTSVLLLHHSQLADLTNILRF